MVPPQVGRSTPKPVCTWLVRAVFNERQYVRRAARTEIVEEVSRHSMPNPDYHQPHGSRTQTVVYKARPTRTAQGRVLARCHRYIDRDGNVIGSGMPDPKTIFDWVEPITAAHPDDAECSDCAVYRPRNERALAALRQRMALDEGRE